MKLPIVKEIWMLWKMGKNKGWLIALDDPDPHTAYLCYFSQKAAIAGQKHQKELWDVKTVPIRVK